MFAIMPPLAPLLNWFRRGCTTLPKQKAAPKDGHFMLVFQ
ncbi:hypothetical protein SAMN05519105_3082 [Rhodobacter sp. 24-YEA-8]|nr:hypothetical protein SAMN05519105_3082 [Rhodobacter sp. 24-YEA-8]